MLLISRDMAQSIVEEIEAVINERINIMDSDGIIMASSDESRLGQYHGGAYRVVAEKLSELTVQFDGEYTGSRQGINFPIVIENEIVGVVGISGERDQVLKFGHIIKKMTEILLLEYYRTSRLIHDEQARNSFLSDLLFREQLDDRTVRTQAQAFGIDILSSALVAVCEVTFPASRDATDSNRGDKTIRERILEEIRWDLRIDPKAQVLMHGTAYVLFLGAEMQLVAGPSLEAMKSRIESAWNIRIACGLGPVTSDYTQIRQSYQSAVKAASISSIYFGGAVTLFEALGVERIVEELPRPVRTSLHEKVFHNCSDIEIEEWYRLLMSYFKLNGSINRIADDLFIHKNTVQYRLTKLKDQTGYDVRDTRDAVMLYLAMLFHRSLNS